MPSPKFLVIAGPSGAGKTTIINELLKVPIFELSVSYTTRPPRTNEVHGKHYFYTSVDDFKDKVNNDFFVECTQFKGNYYGTPASCAVKEGKIVILDVESDGLQFFKRKFPRSFFCLVTIGRSQMERRLRERMWKEETFTEDEFVKRMETFDIYNEIDKHFQFNRIVDNSGGIDSVKRIAKELAEEVIDYYGEEVKNR